jgi:hypothetical protein
MMNKHIEDLAYKTGMFCDGTPDSWDTNAINDFALCIINNVIDNINQTPTQQLTATTYDLQLVTATKQRITKYLKEQYGITTNNATI